MSTYIYFSQKAYSEIVNEVYSHIDTETGGIFLGQYQNGNWYVIETIDPGYNDIIRNYAYFEYDRDYVNHLSNIISKKYKKPLVLIGLWHRHPGSMDTFSFTDDTTNKKFSALEKRGAISALVNIDPDFRLTCYYVPHRTLPLFRPSYKKITNILVGDNYIPNEFLELQNYEEIIRNANQIEQNFIIEDTNNSSFSLNNSPKLDSQIEDRLFNVLDIELDYLENQNEYQYKINPVNYSDNSITIELSYLGNFDYYPNGIIFKISVRENLNTYYFISINHTDEQRGIYKSAFLKNLINNYIKNKIHQNESTSDILSKIIFINNYLKKLQYDNLILDENYSLENLRKVKRVIMNIIHTDKKDKFESPKETKVLTELAKKINGYLSDLEFFYKNNGKNLNVSN